MESISRIVFPVTVIIILMALSVAWYGNAFWAKRDGFIVDMTNDGFILATEGETYEEASGNKKSYIEVRPVSKLRMRSLEAGDEVTVYAGGDTNGFEVDPIWIW